MRATSAAHERGRACFLSSAFSPDPAFVAILLYFMTVTAIAHALAFHLTGTAFLSLSLTFPLLHLLVTGAVVATATTYYLRATLPPPPAHSHTPVPTAADIEWLYAFDVHCNAFFPGFLSIYVIQYFLLPVFLGGGGGGGRRVCGGRDADGPWGRGGRPVSVAAGCWWTRRGRGPQRRRAATIGW